MSVKSIESMFKPRLYFRKQVGGEKLVAPSVKNAGSLQPREFAINNRGDWKKVIAAREEKELCDPGI